MTVSSEHGFRVSSAILLLIFFSGLIAGGILTYYVASQQITSLRNDISNLRSRVSTLWGFQNVTNQYITVYQNATVLSNIYEQVKDAVVLVRGITSTAIVQGSGFVYDFSGTPVVITNYHVVHGTLNMSVTFADGDGYPAIVNGTDPYSDLATLIVNAPQSEFKPLQVVNSSTLRVGDPVIAIGNPYGLVGSMTTGVVSALGRTITEDITGGFAIANIIQTSTPINPGNSGGPLLNYDGKVIGVTAAIVADSQGLGFAIPSNAILREIYALVTDGTYTGHSYLGLNGSDMDYDLSLELGVNVTFGWAVVNVIQGGPSDGKLMADDVIIAMNMTRIQNGDNLASYLEEHTLPDDSLVLTVVRGLQTQNVTVTLGTRPSP
jgi:S1-C subfamily serine protease